MKKERQQHEIHTRVFEEWNRCRETIQNFDELLTRLRLQGPAVFLTFLGASAVVSQLGLIAASCVIVLVATLFITIIWLLDSRLSHYMLTVAERAVELEDEFADGKSITRRIAETYLKLPRIQRLLVPFLYICLIICGVTALVTILMLQYGKMWPLLVGIVITVPLLVLMKKSFRLYSRASRLTTSGGKSQIAQEMNTRSFFLMIKHSDNISRLAEKLEVFKECLLSCALTGKNADVLQMFHKSAGKSWQQVLEMIREVDDSYGGNTEVYRIKRVMKDEMFQANNQFKSRIMAFSFFMGTDTEHIAEDLSKISNIIGVYLLENYEYPVLSCEVVDDIPALNELLKQVYEKLRNQIEHGFSSIVLEKRKWNNIRS